jgi:signal transduction histidine kinase
MIEMLMVIAGVVIAALIGLFVLSRGLQNWSTRAYGLMTLSFIILMIANLFTLGTVVDSSFALLCIRVVAAMTTAVLTSLYFVTQFLAVESRSQHYNRAVNVFVSVFGAIVLIIHFTPFVFADAQLGRAGDIAVEVSFGIVLFILQAFTVLGLVVVHLLRGIHKGSKPQRGQNASILIGVLPALILAPITSFVLPIVYGQVIFVSLTPLYIVFFIGMVAYAMIRHGLFDIRLAVVRTATYILSLTTLASVYLVVAFLIFGPLLGQQTLTWDVVFNILLTLLLAFAFQPIKRFFDKLTNRVFYQDNYNVDDFFTEISSALTSTNDLHGLLSKAVQKIAYTVKSSDASFVIYNGDERSEQIGSGQYSRLSYKDARWLDEYFGTSVAGPKVLALLDAQDDPLRRMMVSHKIAIILPLQRQETKMGYLFLGEHKRSHYNPRDIRVLWSLADELVIAIQNALTVEQIKELNAHLEQRIDAATKELRRSNSQLQKLDEAKDEFISMASHQLRTPLTSIKGYLSMMVEGDVGDVTPEQKHVLGEAFISSERMVRLIGDFLNVSRLQTGKFIIDKHPVDMAKLVQREIDNLIPNAAARGMKFIYSVPKNIPLLDVDGSKLQQVIMNFCDNALYYSKDNGEITVSLKKKSDCVEFTVKDNGIGVPAAEQAHLFNKFFRATNARRARPDGTGVGLFLAKKVVDAHDGAIVFSSKEGKGSTFGFKLPLPNKK